MKTKTIPASQNEAAGFSSTMKQWAKAAWPVAMKAIAEETGQPLESVRAFLDSTSGRHFGWACLEEFHRETGGLDEAIITLAKKWQSWPVGKMAARRHHIPATTPYLTAWVQRAMISDAAA